MNSKNFTPELLNSLEKPVSCLKTSPQNQFNITFWHNFRQHWLRAQKYLQNNPKPFYQVLTHYINVSKLSYNSYYSWNYTTGVMQHTFLSLLYKLIRACMFKEWTYNKLQSLIYITHAPHPHLRTLVLYPSYNIISHHQQFMMIYRNQ